MGLMVLKPVVLRTKNHSIYISLSGFFICLNFVMDYFNPPTISSGFTQAS